MGQFLSIGICTNIAISKKKLELKGFSLEDVQIALSEKFNIEVFDYINTKNEYYQWEINKSIFTSEINDFLKQIYCDYGVSNEILTNEIAKLQTFENIFKYAENKSDENFQLVNYSIPEYVQLGKYNDSIEIHTAYIGLFFAGKILMECYNNMFSFFRNNMRLVYSKYKISGALNVYIAG